MNSGNLDAHEARPEGMAAAVGPALRTSDQMLNTQDGRCRPAARDAYNATIRHFLETGELVEKEMQAFAHIINPPGANVAAWLAYCEAAENIERWIAAHPDEAAKLKKGDAPVESAETLEPAKSLPSMSDGEEGAAAGELLPGGFTVAEDEEAFRAEQRGLPFRSLMQFQWVPKEMRVFARDEYNRCIREFLETGDAPGLVRKDFAWLPPGADEFALKAHREAQRAIGDWKFVHLPKPAESEPPPAEEKEQAASPVSDNHPKSQAVIVRGEAFDLEVTTHRPWPPAKPVSRLPVSGETRNMDGQAFAEDRTEALLNAIIGEMHFNMREIAFGSMRQATDLNDRMEWVNASMRMAECGARVAQSVARLRGFDAPEPRARSRAKR